MFEINKPQPKKEEVIPDGTIGLECPKASDVPPPLMLEYQQMLASPTKHQIKFSRHDIDRDVYEIDNGEAKPSTVIVREGASPSDLLAITGLADHLNQIESYKDGLRLNSMFDTKYSTPEKPVSVVAGFKHDGDKEYVAAELGTVLTMRENYNFKASGSFAATFDVNGHITSYFAGPKPNARVDALKNCTNK